MHHNFMRKRFEQEFPEFYQALKEREGAELEQVLPPATDSEIAEIERRCGVHCRIHTSGCSDAHGGFGCSEAASSFGPGHPFFHDFPALEDLTPQQRQV